MIAGEVAGTGATGEKQEGEEERDIHFAVSISAPQAA